MHEKRTVKGFDYAVAYSLACCSNEREGTQSELRTLAATSPTQACWSSFLARLITSKWRALKRSATSPASLTYAQSLLSEFVCVCNDISTCEVMFVYTCMYMGSYVHIDINFIFCIYVYMYIY